MDISVACREDVEAAAVGALGRTIAVAVLAFVSAVVLSVASPSASVPPLEAGPTEAALPAASGTLAKGSCRAERVLRVRAPAIRYGGGGRA
jgi:hypothetical protein